MSPVEVWAGVECTVNRVGAEYRDQLELTGHAQRPDDIALLASLGVRCVRYPVLWERVAPNGLTHADWRWTDQRLEALRDHGIRPIVGLVHHGSGPADTSLLDPAFPRRLSEFARAVAERYPWVDAYTPVNEPLTTARFSALYGHWYPHAASDGSFLRAIFHQIHGIQQSMAAIRSVHPGACLVQTEDYGYTRSTPALSYQAEYENHRRWLSLDLLTGRVDDAHPLLPWMAASGVDAEALAELRTAPVLRTDDIIGINYYMTSERYLDERITRYPEQFHGGNGRTTYADVEAVRVVDQPILGHDAVLREVWERYHLPIAITEVHLGSSREEQLRWMSEAWEAARTLADAGVDVRAVTAWAAFGSCDWDSLILDLRGHYEPGLFDARSDPPRATALAGAVAALAAGRAITHPVASAPGWWRRHDRFWYGDGHPMPAGRE